jgi:Amt family ammonium transporter
MSVNGFLGGLVAITCPCYWVSPFGAVIIGAVAGIVVPLGIDFMEWRRWDDPIGAVAVHGFCGIWGTLSLGVLATGQYGVPTADGFDKSTVVRGLFYGGGGEQLFAQFIGSMTCVVVVLSVTMLIMKAISAIPGTWNLRVTHDGELEGLDIHEHGSPAYHVEFGQGMTYSAPPNWSSLPSREAPREDPGGPRIEEPETPVEPADKPVEPAETPV